MRLLCDVFRDPGQVRTWDNTRWNRFLIEARVANLLGRTWYRLQAGGVLDETPQRVRHHLRGGLLNTAYIQTQARRELRHVRRILQPAGIPIIALKGIAYVVGDLAPAPWRGMSDIDILVPRERLDETEALLAGGGWRESGTFDDYDRAYYRDWMHELPPLRHRLREVEVDVHHNLTPPVSRIRLDARQLWQQAQPTGEPDVLRLGDTDLLLHNATHLLFNDELRGGLRDLVDFHDLFSDFQARDEVFATRLIERAETLGCQRPLYYAVRAAKRLLGTPFPPPLLERVADFAAPAPVAKLTEQLIDRSLARSVPQTWPERTADFLLFVRSHWVRMPPPMLARHLLTKAVRRRPAEPAPIDTPAARADQ